MKLPSFLGIVALLAFCQPVFAAVVHIEVPPGPQKDLPLVLAVQSEPQASGDVRFSLTISENQGHSPDFAKFVKNFGASLGTMVVKWYSEEERRKMPYPILGTEGDLPIRPLPSTREGNVIHCTFTVTRKELENPDLALLFGGEEPSPNLIPGGTVYYVRLRKFLTH